MNPFVMFEDTWKVSTLNPIVLFLSNKSQNTCMAFRSKKLRYIVCFEPHPRVSPVHKSTIVTKFLSHTQDFMLEDKSDDNFTMYDFTP